jgi:hypothetical protein
MSIVETVRELVDEARAFADSVQSPKKKYRRTRDEAAVLLNEATNGRFTGDWLRRTDCPYVMIGKRAMYADDDLALLARHILDNALPRRAAPSAPRRARIAHQARPTL